MSRILGLVESPAQLLNAVEWVYAQRPDAHLADAHLADAQLMILAPTDAVTRLQLHRLAELVGADGFEVDWAEVRDTPDRLRVLLKLARLVRCADTVVIGDPYSGMISALLTLADDPQVVVVDDGTAVLHYADQWAAGAELKRWHLRSRSRASRLAGGRAERLLGRRSPAVRLFTAMPIRHDIPTSRNDYAWVRHRFAAPHVAAGTDLMGSSLVETGVVAESAYLEGVRRLIADRAVSRYLPHRRESETKLAAIEGLGARIVRPDLPMEAYARRGPIGRTILSFPSTVLYTLPLVLAGTGVVISALSVDDDWFSEGIRGEEVAFVRAIGATGTHRAGSDLR